MSQKRTTETWTAKEYLAYVAKRQPHVPTKAKANKNSGNKAKWEMDVMLKLTGLEYEKEFEFHPVRKWRFDWSIPSLKIGIEYEGLFSEKSGHTTMGGFIKDVEKYREAAKLGWTVLRYTNKDYKQMSEDINQIIKAKKSEQTVENI